MSPPVQRTVTLYARFPRVSGDEPGADGQAYLAAPFSPRERG